MTFVVLGMFFLPFVVIHSHTLIMNEQLSVVKIVLGNVSDSMTDLKSMSATAGPIRRGIRRPIHLTGTSQGRMR